MSGDDLAASSSSESPSAQHQHIKKRNNVARRILLTLVVLGLSLAGVWEYEEESEQLGASLGSDDGGSGSTRTHNNASSTNNASAPSKELVGITADDEYNDKSPRTTRSNQQQRQYEAFSDKRNVGDEEETFSACLLVKDDNHRLPEVGLGTSKLSISHSTMTICLLIVLFS